MAGPGGDQLIGINDIIKGIAHRVKGAVIQSLGNIAGKFANGGQRRRGADLRQGEEPTAARGNLREAVENELASVEPRARVVPIKDQAKR